MAYEPITTKVEEGKIALPDVDWPPGAFGLIANLRPQAALNLRPGACGGKDNAIVFVFGELPVAERGKRGSLSGSVATADKYAPVFRSSIGVPRAYGGKKLLELALHFEMERVLGKVNGVEHWGKNEG